jgi:uncharacterized protein (TIGR02757 family)
LHALRAEFHGKRIDSDPLVFATRFARPDDREVVAFLSASLAFGRVASIQASISRVLACLGPFPARFLETWDGGPISGLGTFVHRWIREEDLSAFLFAVGDARREAGSLGALFQSGDPSGGDFVPALDAFFSSLRQRALRSGRAASGLSHGLRFLLPMPGEGSACKRAHLFLRWVVRDGDPDLGLWRGGGFDTARLLLPMDTHVHRISTYLGLTGRPTADLTASREATSWLKRIDPADPVAYDWALSRLGILAECVKERSRRHCERCAVRPACRVALTPRRPALAEVRALD